MLNYFIMHFHLFSPPASNHFSNNTFTFALCVHYCNLVVAVKWHAMLINCRCSPWGSTVFPYASDSHLQPIYCRMGPALFCLSSDADLCQSNAASCILDESLVCIYPFSLSPTKPPPLLPSPHPPSFSLPFFWGVTLICMQMGWAPRADMCGTLSCSQEV